MKRPSRRDLLLLAAAAIPGAAMAFDAPACSICGGRVSGRYMRYTLQNGAQHVVCSACERVAPRCSACSAPFAGRALTHFPADGSNWCRECLARTPRCSLCRLPVRGEYMKLEHHSGLWCAACWNGEEHCDLCHAPMTRPAETYPDGRRICSGCEATTVRGAEAYRQKVLIAAPAITKLLGASFTPPPIQPVTLDELNAALAEIGRDRGGGDVEIRELGLFRVRGREQSILILDGLPEDLAFETVAHELAHAWLHQNIPGERRLLLEEGFAQWVAEAVCYEAYHRSGLQRLRQREDLYGKGFRLISELEIEGGRERVLETMRTNTIPP